MDYSGSFHVQRNARELFANSFVRKVESFMVKERQTSGGNVNVIWTVFEGLAFILTSINFLYNRLPVSEVHAFE